MRCVVLTGVARLASTCVLLTSGLYAARLLRLEGDRWLETRTGSLYEEAGLPKPGVSSRLETHNAPEIRFRPVLPWWMQEETRLEIATTNRHPRGCCISPLLW